MKRVLVTGAAGFIGANLAKALVEDHEVIGLDNLNDYYDVRLKESRLATLKESPQANKDGVKYKLYNIGNNNPASLMDFVNTLEHKLIKHGVIDKTAEKELLPMQPGDVYQTYADISDMERDFGFRPRIGLEEGLEAFVKWYKVYVV